MAHDFAIQLSGRSCLSWFNAAKSWRARKRRHAPPVREIGLSRLLSSEEARKSLTPRKEEEESHPSNRTGVTDSTSDGLPR